MNQRDNTDNIALHNILVWGVCIFSIVFVFILGNGYYNLFVLKSKTVAILAGLVLPILAWIMARFIGKHHDGIKGNLPFFVLLLLLSAVGVFNALMVNLEGKQIYQEAIEEVGDEFKNLSVVATKSLSNPNAEEKKERVENLKTEFFGELKNPLNCGQGKVARQIGERIRAELPTFQMLSDSEYKKKAGRDCGDMDAVISYYTPLISKLLENTKEYIGANYADIQILKKTIASKEISTQDKLDKIRQDINDGENLLTIIRPELEQVATEYQKYALELSKYAASNDFKKRLVKMEMVRNLGEWSKIIDMIIDRLDKVSTYVYLSLAGFFDWILVYFYHRLKILKNDIPNKPSTPTTNISSPWKND